MDYSQYIGQKYNSWTIQDYIIKNNAGKFICKCDCGHISCLHIKRILSLKSKKCRRCLVLDRRPQLNLINKQFGDFKVIKKTHIFDRQHLNWECECKNGHKRIIRKEIIDKNNNLICQQCKKINEIPQKNLDYVIKYMVDKNKLNKYLDVNLTSEYLIKLIEKQEYKCKLSKIDIILREGVSQINTPTASLDRIDSSKGYEVGNLQWLHKDINVMKWHFPLNRFVYYCYLINNPENSNINKEGFLIKNWCKNFKGYNNITKRWFTRKLKAANNKGIYWDLTIENIWEIYEKQQGLCYYTNLPINFRDYWRKNIENGVSIDRVDNNYGYILKNVVLCHKDINIMKLDFTLETFYKYSKLIYENNKDIINDYRL